MSKIRVLIAEDPETVREGLRLIIDTQDDPQVCGEAGNGREAIRLAEELLPDVLLMDISMPELNGLKAAAKLKRIAPEIKILILTRHTDEAYLQELLQAGVSGYVLKQSAAAEVAARHSRRRGRRQLPRSVDYRKSFRQLRRISISPISPLIPCAVCLKSTRRERFSTRKSNPTAFSTTAKPA